MSEDNTPPVSDDGENTPPGSGDDADKTTDYKGEAERYRKELNKLAAERRVTLKKVEDLEAQLSELSKDGNPDGGKSKERLSAAEQRIQQLEATLSEKDGKIRDFEVKGRFKEEAIKAGIVPERFDVLWKLEGHKIDLHEDSSGEVRIGLKDQPYTQLSDYFETELKQEMGFLFGNKRAKGTGEPNKGDTSVGEGGNVKFPNGFDNYSQKQKEDFFRGLSPEQRGALRKEMGLR